VLVNGKTVGIPENAVIQTPFTDDKAITRIAFGTCAHRRGLGNVKNIDQILAFKPHAMIAYGDIAVQDRKTHLGLHRADYVLRDLHPAWNSLACAVPVYASWDDHDYSHNDGYGLKAFNDEARRGVRAVFAQNWNNPYYGLGQEGGGIFTHTRVGACDIIMTDNRYFRSADGKGSKGCKNAFLGSEQMEWLKKTLLACKGPFIILTCGTMWDDTAAEGKDSWGVYDPEGREEIYRLIETHKIPGVLFLSGDRHGARIFRIPRPAGHDFYEFEVATLGGARSTTAATNEAWKNQLFGMQSIYAHGRFTFDLSGDEPTVTHQLVQEDGTVLFELKLTRSQLTPVSSGKQ
jgi:alkaline phosphatase D